jgi:SPP1 family predicted phage head-tail adaptor
LPISFKNGIPWIDPAKLRHRITFLDPESSMGAGGVSTKWLPGDPPERAWAEVLPMRGTDVIKAGQDVSQVWLTITIRFRKSVRADRRILGRRGNRYVIQAIENVAEMDMFLVLNCLAIGPND